MPKPFAVVFAIEHGYWPGIVGGMPEHIPNHFPNAIDELQVQNENVVVQPPEEVENDLGQAPQDVENVEHLPLQVGVHEGDDSQGMVHSNHGLLPDDSYDVSIDINHDASALFDQAFPPYLFDSQQTYDGSLSTQ